MTASNPYTAIRCSFCGQPQSDARLIVVTPYDDAAICDACIQICVEMITGHFSLSARPATLNWPHGSMGEYVEDTR